MSVDLRADWLAWRREGIGGSDVGGILGLSPWESPYSVWLSKVSALTGDEPTAAMEFGVRAEPMLARWFTDRTELVVAGEQTWCTHRSEPWMRCTVDGFVVDSFGAPYLASALGVAEWKTTGDAEGEWRPQVPHHYACQATWSMAVTDQPVVWFGVLHLAFGRPEFRVYEFARDLGDEAFVVDACRRFWTDHVLTGEPPPLDAHPATTAALKLQWPTPEGSVDADDHARLLVEQYHYFTAEAASATAELEATKNELRGVLADRDALVDGVDAKGRARVIASWKSQTARRVDIDRLRVAYPDLCREFETESSVRVLRVPKRKEAH